MAEQEPRPTPEILDSKLYQQLLAEYEAVGSNPTDTYNARQFAGLMITCGLSSFTIGARADQRTAEAAALLSKVFEQKG